MKEITKLKDNEIFVFGSNKNGNHIGGAALQAKNEFGAIEGVSEGLTGQCYAFPTLNEEMQKVSVEDFEKSVKLFRDCAIKNENSVFLLTKVGCGIAGFDEDFVKDKFLYAQLPGNVVLPEDWTKGLKGYKAFKQGLVCEKEGHRVEYKVGKTVVHKGKIAPCSSGLHFCLNPFDVLNYYDLTESEFAEVEALGDVKFHEEDSKVVTNKLKVKVKLGLPQFVSAAFEFLWERTKDKDDGSSSQVATSGSSSKVATSGDFSQVATSGYSSKVATSGDFSQVATSGSSSKVATSGDFSQVATSGYSSKVATSGDFSKVATSGYSSKVATSGDFSKVATSGYSSKVEVKGEYSVGANIGSNGIIKGKKGNWITLAEYDYSGKVECVKSAQIDGRIIKEDVWYKLVGGEFKEVEG